MHGDLYARDGGARSIIDATINVALGKLQIRKIAVDISQKTAKQCYKHSFDGPAIARWIGDLHAELVETEMDLDTIWRKRTFKKSRFLRAVSNAYQRLNRPQDYEQLRSILPVLKSFCMGFTAAMKMRPTPEDYGVVAEYLPRFAVEKGRLWPGKLTWYDNHCLYHFPFLMRKWGSLGLISQEGVPGDCNSAWGGEGRDHVPPTGPRRLASPVREGRRGVRQGEACGRARGADVLMMVFTSLTTCARATCRHGGVAEATQ